MIGERRVTLLLLIILCVTLVAFLNVEIVKAEDTIYIRADGSVEGTDKIQRDGNIYTFTDDIYGQIVIEKDGITVDGSQHVLHGMNEGGIFLENRSAVVLRDIEVVDAPFGIALLNGRNNIITGSNCSIKLDNSVNNTISGNKRISLLFNNSSKNIVTGNNLSGNTYGFKLQSGSNENNIFGNNITDSTGGIEFHGNSSYNMVHENWIVDNADGMIFYNSYNNSIYDNVIAYNNLVGVHLYSTWFNRFFRNDFVDNGEWCQASARFSSNFWDDGSTGNYWSDYNGTDADGDGIGDEPYLIPLYTLMGWDWEYDADNYPLMELYTIPENPTLPTLPYAPFDLFPEPASIDVPLDTNISISISRPPSIVNMSISPEVEVKERIDEVIAYNGRYTFILSELLEPSTTYNVTVVFGDKGAPEGFAPTSTRTWNFTTVAEEPEEPDSYILGAALAIIGIAATGGIALLIFFKKTKKRRGEVK